MECGMRDEYISRIGYQDRMYILEILLGIIKRDVDEEGK